MRSASCCTRAGPTARAARRTAGRSRRARRAPRRISIAAVHRGTCGRPARGRPPPALRSARARRARPRTNSDRWGWSIRGGARSSPCPPRRTRAVASRFSAPGGQREPDAAEQRRRRHRDDRERPRFVHHEVRLKREERPGDLRRYRLGRHGRKRLRIDERVGHDSRVRDSVSERRVRDPPGHRDEGARSDRERSLEARTAIDAERVSERVILKSPIHGLGGEESAKARRTGSANASARRPCRRQPSCAITASTPNNADTSALRLAIHATGAA